MMSSEAETETTEAMECDTCGRETAANWDLRGETRGGVGYCYECYLYRFTFPCAWCGDDVEELKTQHDYVAVFDAAAVGLTLPGFYRVQHAPYYRQPLIGHGQVFAEAVQWLGHLPADLEEPDWHPCGHFCQTCQRRMLGLIATEQHSICDVR